jgi:hypothetical protein
MSFWISYVDGFLTSFTIKKIGMIVPSSTMTVKTFMNMVENPKDFNVKLSDNLFSTLVSRFQGDFDNYHQVVQDRKMGLTPREGGGHEHLHVTFIPMPLHILPGEMFPVEKRDDICSAVVACYYFDGMPNRIFRLRMYSLYCGSYDEHDNSMTPQQETVQMRLYTFCPELEKILRLNSEYALEKWLKLISDHVLENGSDSFQLLNRCDIQWTENPDEVRHAYLNKFSSNIHNKSNKSVPIHAKMIYDHEQGGVLLESQMMPGTFIRIQDELSLWQDELWINDRGFDADTKKMVYGNWKGVPYQMIRVTNIGQQNDATNNPGQYRRTIVSSDLSWTLGEKWRTAQKYDMKIAAIGGTTSQMNSRRNHEGNGK